MKIVFHNPHLNHFGKTIYDIIFWRKGWEKYGYILAGLQQKKDVKIYFYIDRSSFPFLPKNKLFLLIDVYIWYLVNRINPLRFKIIFTFDNLKKDDIFFSFVNEMRDESNITEKLKDQNFIKVFQLAHFVFNTRRLNMAAGELSNLYLASENNLSKNSGFFQKTVPNYQKDCIILPLGFKKRFKKTIDFGSRKNKCYATGTNHPSIKKYGEGMSTLLDYVGHDTPLHPVRDWIYANKDNLSSIIDSFIDNRYTDTPESPQSFLGKIKKYFSGNQKKYFSVDIVQKFNEYKMFVCGEEICDLPGMSALEGMACGSAYIGKIDPMYSDIGLIPGVHYIGHNNTLEDIIEKITYYQEHSEELEDIAENGYVFVRENLNHESIIEKLYNDLTKLSNTLKN